MSKQAVVLFAIVIMAVSAGASSSSQGGTADPARAPEVAPAAPSLGAVVAEALEKSAELAALRGRIEAVEASVRPVGALPDPMAVVALSNVPVGGLALDRTPMTGVEVGVEQQVPASKKRRLRRQVRSEEAEALWGRYDDLCNDTKRRVKKAYYDVQLLGETLRIAQANKGVAKDLLETAEALYATGKGLQQDVFRAQVRLSRMIDEVVVAREGRAAAGTRLNRLLYRPAGQPVPELPALGREELRLDPEELAGRALERNPRVLALRKQVEQTKTKTELAKAGLRPDYKLGFRYRIRQEIPRDPAFGDDFWSASVAMSLPWVYRSDTVDEEVRGAEATRAAAEAELAALRNELGARVEELVVEGKRLEEQITLLIIVVLLYLNFGAAVKTGIVLLSVPFAVVGSFWLLHILGYNLSTAVWVGVIALAGVAAETGVVMIVYLDDAYEHAKGAGQMGSTRDLEKAVIEGAVQRVRPKVMTVVCILMGLLPLMWAHGSGADVMKRIAAPMIRGVITSTILTLEIVPAIYSFWRQQQLKR